MFFKLAIESLLSRKGSVLMTLMAMTVSIFVLLGVEHIRQEAKESFSNTVSGVDLIVGARTGTINLLLYSVFRVGAPTNNISWASFQEISSGKNVKWAIPISLGDSHKGYRVIGTTENYFKHFSYGNKTPLRFLDGKPFKDIFDVVLGFEVANKLNYKLGDEIVLAHGIARTSFSLHDDRPFTVVGILEPTGTPVDQSLHVSLEGIEAIHIDWEQGVKIKGLNITNDQLKQIELKPKSITAFMVGLNSRIATFRVQRSINQYTKEPLLAILPGVALSQLWQMMAVLENTLRLVSVLVLLAALLGLSAMLLSSIRERDREIQLLRVIGAPPFFIFMLIQLEALVISILSIILGGSILFCCLASVRELLTYHFGLHISANIISNSSLVFLSLVLIATIFAAVIPSFNAYKIAR